MINPTLRRSIEAVGSFFIPGLGQLFQGRKAAAISHFVSMVILWIFTFGTFSWIMHIYSPISAFLNQSQND